MMRPPAVAVNARGRVLKLDSAMMVRLILFPAAVPVTFLLVVFAGGVNGVLLAIDRRLHFRA